MRIIAAKSGLIYNYKSGDVLMRSEPTDGGDTSFMSRYYFILDSIYNDNIKGKAKLISNVDTEDINMDLPLEMWKYDWIKIK